MTEYQADGTPKPGTKSEELQISYLRGEHPGQPDRPETYSYRFFPDSRIAGPLGITGGELHDHIYTQRDRNFAQEVTNASVGELLMDGVPDDIQSKVDPGLRFSEISDREVRGRVLQEFTRQLFGIDRGDLESLTSPGHKEFDRRTKALRVFSGIDESNRKKAGDTATNTLVQAFLGIGDCRPCSWLVNLVEDELRIQKSTEAIMLMDRAIKEDDIEAASVGRQMLRSILDDEARIYDGDLIAPAQMDEFGYPVYKEVNGRQMLVFDAESDVSGGHAIEGHTFNIRRRFVTDEATGDRQKVFSNYDPFYNEVYPLGSGDWSDIRPDDQYGFTAQIGEVEMWDPVSEQVVKRPLRTRPQPFAHGRRCAEDRQRSAHDRLWMLGISTGDAQVGLEEVRGFHENVESFWTNMTGALLNEED